MNIIIEIDPDLIELAHYYLADVSECNDHVITYAYTLYLEGVIALAVSKNPIPTLNNIAASIYKAFCVVPLNISIFTIGIYLNETLESAAFKELKVSINEILTKRNLLTLLDYKASLQNNVFILELYDEKNNNRP